MEKREITIIPAKSENDFIKCSDLAKLLNAKNVRTGRFGIFVDWE